MAIPKPNNLSIDDVLNNLAKKISRLELENTQYELTIKMYENLCDSYVCPNCEMGAIVREVEDDK